MDINGVPPNLDSALSGHLKQKGQSSVGSGKPTFSQFLQKEFLGEPASSGSLNPANAKLIATQIKSGMLNSGSSDLMNNPMLARGVDRSAFRKGPSLAIDSNSLSDLKYASINAHQKGDSDRLEKSIKGASNQVESMFVGMMMKSMRQSNEGFKSGLWGDDSSAMYRDMFDSQMSQELSGKGLGLSSQIEASLRQMSNLPSEKESGSLKTQDPGVTKIGAAVPQQKEPENVEGSFYGLTQTSASTAIEFDYGALEETISNLRKMSSSTKELPDLSAISQKKGSELFSGAELEAIVTIYSTESKEFKPNSSQNDPFAE